MNPADKAIRRYIEKSNGKSETIRANKRKVSYEGNIKKPEKLYYSKYVKGYHRPE